MEFRDLTYLLEVAVTAHLGRAAEHLRITQPALTKCIARLERELEVPLLERTAKGVNLTQFGRHLVRHAERLRAADFDVRRELMELATGRAGHIRIGAGPIFAQHFLSLACIKLLKRYSSLTLDIVSDNTAALFPALREGRLDVVLAGIQSQPEPGFRQVFLMDDPVVVIARKGHRLQKLRRLTAEVLHKERWAMPAKGTLPAQWLNQKWREIGMNPPDWAVRSGSLPTLLGIVAETDLITFQSWSMVKRTNDNGRLLHPLKSDALTWHRSIGVTLRDHGYLSPAIDNLVKSLQETAAGEDPL